MLEISKMLTISTAHITEETDSKLKEQAEEEYKVELIVYKKEDYGYFIHIPIYENINSFFDNLNIPIDLKKCILFAKDLGCEWLCLDCDGEVIEYLEKYDW